MGWFKIVSDALVRTAQALETLSHMANLPAQTGFDDRLRELESSVIKIRAESEALVISATSDFKSARRAEERTRHALKEAGKGPDDESVEDFDLAAAEIAAARSHAPGGGEAEVPDVHPDVEMVGGKNGARAKKWAHR